MLLLSGAGAALITLHHSWYQEGKAAGDADIAELRQQYADQRATFEAAARAQEAADREEKARVVAQYLKEIEDANKTASATIASLRAGNLQLRNEWTNCTNTSVPATGSSSAGVDANAELRYQGATDLVQNADDADAQVRGLQAVLNAERATVKQ